MTNQETRERSPDALRDALDKAMEAGRNHTSVAMDMVSDRAIGRGSVAVDPLAKTRAVLRSSIIDAMAAALREVNAQAEAEMLKTHVLEGAHGRGVTATLAKLDALREDK